MEDYIKELVLFKNEMKNSKPSRYKLIGVVAQIILSTDLFAKNSQIEEFLKNVFDVEFKEYVIASRTLIVARTIRYIDECNEDDYLLYKKRLYKFLDLKIVQPKKHNIFDGWI